MLCITNMLLHGIDVPKIYHDNSLLKDVLDYTQNDQFDVILMNPPYGGNEKAEVKNHFPADLASSETADLFMSVIMYRLKKNGRAAVMLILSSLAKGGEVVVSRGELVEIGQWWGTDSKKKKQIQIDIVGTPVEGKDYIIGSCKYRNEKIGVDELDLIRDYASVFGKGNNYHYYIFSKGGFTDGLLLAQERGEVRLITLEDLYK